MIWLNAADRLCRLLSVEMALTMTRNDARSPTSDWHQGYIDLRHLLELKLRTCVARIPPPAGAVNKIAERGSPMRAPSVSAAVVVGGQDAYPAAGKLHEVARLDLAELQTAGGEWLEQSA